MTGGALSVAGQGVRKMSTTRGVTRPASHLPLGTAGLNAGRQERAPQDVGALEDVALHGRQEGVVQPGAHARPVGDVVHGLLRGL